MWDLVEAEQILMALMPPNSRVSIDADKKLRSDFILRIFDKRVRARYVQHANLAAIKDALVIKPKPEVLLLSRTTPAIREFLEEKFIGWADQSGSAQISTGPLIIARDKIRVQQRKRQVRWTRSMLGVAEVLLTGTPGTVSAVSSKTGLAQSSAATALQRLTEMDLLTAEAIRGRRAGRKITKYSELLSAYSEAAITKPHEFTIRVGVLWQNPIKSLTEVGRIWTQEGMEWAATSAIAAAVLAPFATQIAPLEIYLNASSPASMFAALKIAGLKPLDGGRLTVSPFPSEGTRRQSNTIQSIPIVPWPRVYADLQHAGVRGEELAEHLRESMEFNHVD